MKVIGSRPASVERDARSVKLVSEEGGALDLLRNQLRDRHVRGVARRLLLAKQKKGSTSLMLNRQAAAVGVVALCSAAEQSPLGPIYATIESERIGAVIDWLTAYESG